MEKEKAKAIKSVALLILNANPLMKYLAPSLCQ